MGEMTFERLHHETSKKGNITDIEKKIQALKEISEECTDDTLIQYYNGHIQAYIDCIDIIHKDKHY